MHLVLQVDCSLKYCLDNGGYCPLKSLSTPLQKCPVDNGQLFSAFIVSDLVFQNCPAKQQAIAQNCLAIQCPTPLSRHCPVDWTGQSTACQNCIVHHAVLKANLGTHTTVADRWALGPAHQCSVGPIGHASQIVPPTAAQGARNVGNWHPLLRSTFWNTCLLRSKKWLFCLLRSTF